HYVSEAYVREPEVSEPSEPSPDVVIGSNFCRITRRSQCVRTPGAISSTTVSSLTVSTVACSPEVVRTRSPAVSESCISRIAFIALRCFELWTNISTISTMIIRGNRISIPMWTLSLRVSHLPARSSYTGDGPVGSEDARPRLSRVARDAGPRPPGGPAAHRDRRAG